MKATKRRIAIHDFLLVAASVAAIVLSSWPDTESRQLVQVRDRDGVLRDYAFALNDPALSKLRLGLEKWTLAGQETQLAVAQWRADLAEFYAARTEKKAKQASPFQTASFSMSDKKLETPGATPGDTADAIQQQEAKSLASEHQHWVRVRAEAQREIERITTVQHNRRSLEVPPPVVFGGIESGHKPQHAFWIALAIGILLGAMFTLWDMLCPPYALRSVTGVAEPTPDDGRSNAMPHVNGDAASIGPELMRLQIPEQWVRVRQPIGVLARRAAMVLLACTAMAVMCL